MQVAVGIGVRSRSNNVGGTRQCRHSDKKQTSSKHDFKDVIL